MSDEVRDVGFRCIRCGLWQSCEAEGGKAVLAEAEKLNWQWTRDGWLCPDHRHTFRGLTLLFMVTVTVSIAALAFRALALAWCWNHVAPTLWSAAPHVQAWQTLALLLFKLFGEQTRDPDDRPPRHPREILERQRDLVIPHAIITALSWGAMAIVVQVFAR